MHFRDIHLAKKCTAKLMRKQNKKFICFGFKYSYRSKNREHTAITTNNTCIVFILSVSIMISAQNFCSFMPSWKKRKVGSISPSMV